MRLPNIYVGQSSTSADTFEILEKRLRSTDEWSQVQKLCSSDDFVLPHEINYNFALSFLAQTSQLNEYPLSYLAAFVKVISVISIRKLPPHVLTDFIPFLKQFRSHEEHNLADLICLFEFTKAVGIEWQWLSYCPDRAVIITLPEHCTLA